jgi:hypothetical protein
MRRILTAVGILAMAGTVLAAQAATATTGKQATTKSTQTAKTAKSTAKPTVTGTVDKFENNVLTVTTKKGAENFTVGTETVIQEAGKKVDTAALKTGEKVTVRYTEANGAMTASRVTISKASATGTSGKTPEKNEKKK